MTAHLLASPILLSVPVPNIASAFFGALIIIGLGLLVASVVQWQRGRNG